MATWAHLTYWRVSISIDWYCMSVCLLEVHSSTLLCSSSTSSIYSATIQILVIFLPPLPIVSRVSCMWVCWVSLSFLFSAQSHSATIWKTCMHKQMSQRCVNPWWTVWCNFSFQVWSARLCQNSKLWDSPMTWYTLHFLVCCLET